MKEYLVVVVAICLLTRIVLSWVWFDRKDMTRLSISMLYLAVAVFSVLRLIQMSHAIAIEDDGGLLFSPISILVPTWTVLLISNVIMSITLTRDKFNGSKRE